MLATAHLATAVTIVRLTLHVLAATIWVGGQITVAGVLPTVRGFGPEAPAKIARAFARLSWPAFVVLVATGFWNLSALDHGGHTNNWNAVLNAKMGIVVIAAVAVFWHSKTRTATLRGVTAGVGLLASMTALVLGIALAG